MSSNSSQEQFCRLCHEPRQLVKSHIVPEFLHRPVYDAEHTALFVDLEAGRVGDRKTGLWEKLLCRQCEGRIGKLESYFAEAWFTRGLRPRPVVRPRGPLLRVTGLDYTQFKLFHLSIIWRAGVSTLGAFAGFRLGSHEERLRRMLLDGDPGPADRYGMSAVALVGDDGGYKDDMLQIPRPGKKEGHHFYSAMFGGVFWLYVISSHRQGWPVPSTLSPDGTLLMAAQKWSENSAVLEAAAGLRRLGDNPPTGPTHL
jgi:hypothetical protein